MRLDNFEKWTCWQCSNFSHGNDYCDILEERTYGTSIGCICEGKLFDGEKYYHDRLNRYYQGKHIYALSEDSKQSLVFIGFTGGILFLLLLSITIYAGSPIFDMIIFFIGSMIAFTAASKLMGII